MSKKPKVYLSCSYRNHHRLKEAITVLSKTYDISYNEKEVSAYDDSKIQKAEFVGIILSNFDWSRALNLLSSGVLKEVVWCINNRKPMFIVYKTRTEGIIKLYSARITSELTIEGIAETTMNVKTLSEINPILVDYSKAEEDVLDLISKPLNRLKRVY